MPSKAHVPEVFGKYSRLNRKLAGGEQLLYDRGRVGQGGGTEGGKGHPLRYPSIGIYCGEGASHSWTWFVESLERLGFYDLVFLGEGDVRPEVLADLDVFLMSGGDTFSIAESLGVEGSETLRNFVDSGGVYVGSCAGGYLPLRSSLEPLSRFNWVGAKIANMAKRLPEPKALPEKFCTEYGCSYVFHPVREEVRLKMVGSPPFSSEKPLVAPLYGGPVFSECDDMTLLAEYTSFTNKTLFLVDEELARETLIGNGAVGVKDFGKGRLYLCGPHLEHPLYPEANGLLAEMIYEGIARGEGKSEPAEAREKKIARDLEQKLVRSIKGEVSNSRIVAFGLERYPISWKIGKKFYEPVKLSVFLEVIWSRLKEIDSLDLFDGDEKISSLEHMASSLTRQLRQLKQEIELKEETTPLAASAFGTVKRLSSLFLGVYFQMKKREVVGLRRSQRSSRGESLVGGRPAISS